MHVRFAAALVLMLGVSFVSRAEAECRKGQVFVKSKTPLRRGPGLNFPVSLLMDEGKCRKMMEMSADQNWLLVEDPETNQIGWVPASAIEAADLAGAGSPKPNVSGPIGSGSERGFITLRSKTSLLAGANGDADVKRTLAGGTKMLALSVSKDEKWVEVRDERGTVGWVPSRVVIDEASVLPSLPRESKTIVHKDPPRQKPKVVEEDEEEEEEDEVEEKPVVKKQPRVEKKVESKPSPTRIEKAIDAEDEDEEEDEEVSSGPIFGTRQLPFQLSGELIALGSLPKHGLDSNGTRGIRRYRVSAFATGLHLGMQMTGLGPLVGRLAYDFVMMTGLAPADDPSKKVAAQQHDARLVLGYPLFIGDVMLLPEGGLAFVRWAMQPALPGSTEIQFVSSNSFGLNLGATARIPFSKELSADAELASLIGTTSEGAIDLGGAKITLGVRIGADLKYQIGDGAALVAFWNYVFRKSPFSGPSITDKSITNASLTHAENLFGLGVSLTL